MSAIALVLGASVVSPAVGAAQTPFAAQAAHADCINDAMLRGLSGEQLKRYVDSCIRQQGLAPFQAPLPAATDTPAC